MDTSKCVTHLQDGLEGGPRKQQPHSVAGEVLEQIIFSAIMQHVEGKEMFTESQSHRL